MESQTMVSGTVTALMYTLKFSAYLEQCSLIPSIFLVVLLIIASTTKKPGVMYSTVIHNNENLFCLIFVKYAHKRFYIFNDNGK
jgi:hypothetical protein